MDIAHRQLGADVVEPAHRHLDLAHHTPIARVALREFGVGTRQAGVDHVEEPHPAR